MSDIVERLPSLVGMGAIILEGKEIARIVDEIESLRQRVKELEAMLDASHDKLEAVLDASETQGLNLRITEKMGAVITATHGGFEIHHGDEFVCYRKPAAPKPEE